MRSSQRPLPSELAGLSIKTKTCFDSLDDDYDAIFITNPTALHFETLMMVGAKGRCFFIEKPVFNTGTEDVALIPLKPDALCYVAAPLRYTRVLQEAKKVLATLSVYSVRAISSSYLPDWRPGVDYRTVYSAHRDMGGGVAIDLIHEWDYLSMLFGFPKKVFSMAGKYSHLEIDSDDLAVYIADYGDKLAELHLDYFGRRTIRVMEAYTPDGMFEFDIANACVTLPDGTQHHYCEQPNDKYLAEMHYFLSLLKGQDDKSQNTIEHACKVLRLTRGSEI
jgi:predicted dehydrogenase